MRGLVASAVGLAMGVTVGFACGAENLVAPEAPKRADVRECRGFERLMPNFVAAIDEGRTQNLKTVVEQELLKPLREGEAPPVNDVMRSLFRTMTRFAEEPPERGAPEGALCVSVEKVADLPLAQANNLCELRRALQVLVHEGKGVEAVRQFDPQLQILLNYITGQGQTCDARVRAPHYEVAAIFAGFCAQDANCQLSNGLDLVAGFSDYLYTPDGRALIQHLNELAAKQAIIGLLDPSKLTENDAVALVRALIPAVQGADAVALENAFTQLPLPDDVKTELRPLLDDLKKILVRPELIVPVRRLLTCVTSKDKNSDVVRMVYRVAIAEKCPEFGLTRLTEIATGLQRVDARGSLVYVAGAIAKAVRSDEAANDGAASVCRKLFSTVRSEGQARSNAELVLPVVTDLLKSGIINEGICAADTLVFGCAGGSQPACR